MRGLTPGVGRLGRRSGRFCWPAIGILAGLLLFFTLAYPWLEPPAFLHPIRGIDVSHHQTSIAWKKLSAAGVRFAYIKATEGADFRDPAFSTNWREAGEAGMPRGAYHFFTLCRPGVEQADNFLAAVARVADALPPALDAEDMRRCRRGRRVADVAAEITTFLDRVEQGYGRRPIIYTTLRFHEAHLDGRLGHERFWIRSLVLPPTFRRDAWVLWQYHNRGRRRGIIGPVDLNAFAGSEVDFARFRAQP